MKDVGNWLVAVLPWTWAVALGALFAVASLSKALDLDSLRQVLWYTLGLSSGRARTLARGIVAFEALLVGLSLVGFTARLAQEIFFGLAACGLTGFAGWAAYAIHKGLRVECPCFGSRSGLVSWRTVERNGTLTALTAVAIAMRATSTAAPSDHGVGSVTQLIVGLTAVALAILYACYRFVQPHLLNKATLLADLDAE